MLQVPRHIGATPWCDCIIQRGYLKLLVQLRWTMLEPLYVGRVTEDSHAFCLTKYHIIESRGEK